MGTISSLKRKRVKEGGKLANSRKIGRNCQLQHSWVWPFKVEEKIKFFIKGRSINVCAGLSKLGDVKVDLEPKDPEILKSDMNDLPFDDNTFDTVISDPPWKLNFFHRQKPFFEAVRICRVGGRIIYNCVWRPTSKLVKLDRAIIRTDNNWANVSVIWIFTKKDDTLPTKQKK